MAARQIASAFLLSLFFFSTRNMASVDLESFEDSESFDFHYLVLKWPGSYCKDRTVTAGCCKPTTPYPLDVDFLVKGLYTYNSCGRPITKCNNTTPFRVNSLRNLIEDLYVHWTSIECPSNNGVSQWRDAWTNFGVCSGMNQTTYFDKALKLRTKVNILSILKKNGIRPTDAYLYSPSVVRGVIRNELGVDVGLKCSKNRVGENQIDEIFVCVDKTATNVIQCPVLPKFICVKAVKLPTFSNDMLKKTYDSSSSASSFDPLKMVITSQ